ncbi:hypothetical protein F52700_12106 [Fusarium sp. NRRL 52700]|nr:hypothetical protein F52700_12106 [Fusarium sp. NRRL 52700]
MKRLSFNSHVENRELRNSGYRSPATLIFKAISESDNVTEPMVLNLISHDLLVCQPYNVSSLAQVLLSMAIRRGWSNLATFLVDRGTVTVRRVSGVCWPSISTGYAYSLAPRLWSNLSMTPMSGPQVHAPHGPYTKGSKIDFISDLHKSQAPPAFLQNGIEESATQSSQHQMLDDAKDEASCSTSQSEAKSEGDERSAIVTDNSLIHAQLSELGSPSSQTWEQVFGEGKSVPYCGTRGQQTWHHKCRIRVSDIMYSLALEEAFQKKDCQCDKLNAPDPRGATWLMKTCARKEPVLVANTLYFLSRDRVQGAIHQYDKNDMTAVHYAAAVGDVDALKVLLFPGNLFNRAVNIWRLQDGLFLRPEDFEGEGLISDKPPQSWLDIFKELPASTKDRIELPNTNFSEWQLTESESCLMPEKLKSAEKSRTPLHEAALRGKLAAVKFLLSYSGINAKMCDVDGKTAADMALDRDDYDIYNLIVTHMGGR